MGREKVTRDQICQDLLSVLLGFTWTKLESFGELLFGFAVVFLQKGDDSLVVPEGDPVRFREQMERWIVGF